VLVLSVSVFSVLVADGMKLSPVYEGSASPLAFKYRELALSIREE
jgi:hypothetical protein